MLTNCNLLLRTPLKASLKENDLMMTDPRNEEVGKVVLFQSNPAKTPLKIWLKAERCGDDLITTDPLDEEGVSQLN